MTPLHTFPEYQCAKAVVSQLLERKKMEHGLSESDQKGLDELEARVELFEHDWRVETDPEYRRRKGIDVYWD